MGAFFYPIFAIWARTKNNVGSSFWTWNIFAKIAKMAELA